MAQDKKPIVRLSFVFSAATATTTPTAAV